MAKIPLAYHRLAVLCTLASSSAGMPDCRVVRGTGALVVLEPAEAWAVPGTAVLPEVSAERDEADTTAEVRMAGDRQSVAVSAGTAVRVRAAAPAASGREVGCRKP